MARRRRGGRVEEEQSAPTIRCFRGVEESISQVSAMVYASPDTAAQVMGVRRPAGPWQA